MSFVNHTKYSSITLNVFLGSYRFLYAVCAWHVLQIHKRVSEELCKGHPSIWVPLKQPQEKVPAVLGNPAGFSL